MPRALARLALGIAIMTALTTVASAADDARSARLDNGFRVLVRENPVAPVVAVSLLVAMGTRWETPANAGISNFVHAVMVKGTSKRSGSELAEAVAALGGKISASGDIDYSGIRAAALARFWRELLSLTAELALEPRLSADEVDRERDWLQSRIQRRRDSASSRAFDEFYAAVYGNHPYALPSIGTQESLGRIDHAALVAHYRAFYRPERMVLAVSGQVRADDVLAEARRLFGAMPRGTGAPEPAAVAPPRPAAESRAVIEQAAQQTQIITGGVAPPLDHADHAAVKVLSTVLGGGMAGRLFVELRDKSALAYTTSAFYEAVRGPAALALYLGTAPDNASRAEDGLRREIERVRRDLVTPEELTRAKAYLLGRYAMDRRTNERQAWHLAFYEIEGVGQVFPERYRRAVEAVTAEDVLRVAQAYLAVPTSVILRPPGSR